MKSYFQIEVPKRANACFKGQETLVPGSDYFSLLLEHPELGLIRQDFCLACWNKTLINDAVKLHWKAKVPHKKAVVMLSAQDRDERIMEVFRELLAEKTEKSHTEAFILALYLARRKIIYLRQEQLQPDGSTLLLYEVADTEEMLCLKKVILSEIQIEKVQQEIARKLKG